MKQVLMLHGALGSGNQFKDLQASLSGKIKCELFTFSGHGRSPSLQHSFTVQNLAHEVLHHLNHNQTISADFFGYSLGGYVALWLARFYPDRVNRIFTLGTKLIWDPETAEREAGKLNAEKILQKIPAFADQLSQRHGAQQWHSLLQKTAHLLRHLGSEHLSDSDFMAIHCPVLMARGDGDKLVTAEEVAHAGSLIPSFRSWTLENCRHEFESIPLTPLSHELYLFFRD